MSEHWCNIRSKENRISSAVKPLMRKSSACIQKKLGFITDLVLFGFFSFLCFEESLLSLLQGGGGRVNFQLTQINQLKFTTVISNRSE